MALLKTIPKEKFYIQLNYDKTLMRLTALDYKYKKKNKRANPQKHKAKRNLNHNG